MVKLLKKNLIKIGSVSKNKTELLGEIADLVSTQTNSISRESIFKGLKEREKLSSTGVGKGLAIPHCAFDELKEFFVGLIVVNEMDFDAIDNKPVNLVFFSVGPKSEQNQHISTLTAISKISMDPDLITKLKNSKTADDVFQLIHRDERETQNSSIKCQFLIQVQDEELFHDILEILAADVEGSISVVDAQTAGYYLHKLPLFSSFWNDVSDKFSKLIVAVIDKRLMNDTIRRINMIKPDNKTGLLITVTELIYFDGSLEY